MSTSPSCSSVAGQPELGFAPAQGVDWDQYLAYRPTYPESFFSLIHNYHGRKSEAAWTTAHDVGAGCGVVSSRLASRFEHVIVSDPNDGYTALARRLLLAENSPLPERNFTFLQERAEQSSVEDGAADLISACQMMHFVDTGEAVREFGRQIRSGGTLVVSFYAVPRILGNEPAERAWEAIWREFARRATGPLFDRAYRLSNAAYEPLALPEGEWRDVKRVYMNSPGSTRQWMLSGDDRIGEDRVGEGEERVWIEHDDSWAAFHDIAWLRAHLATLVPRIPESELQQLWDELELALDGQKVRLEFPVVVILATKT
ncbi:hypothetical protein M406DRAFT_67292 [Cryphonectria parasitica EP155]|uniref:Methyltransferase type 11 domain-containing protein n=1 Tax=Cryphonectria parasitica (strain ATCC 38755 / EP155) TaxID=660469 RepID=A0A9P4YD99_CRYP1|nr:uncharacterized protein M406DRAFT_67292 [Cryphonectria parasitica EP155]KAF3770935.1 hypothetical protein M406DRAFT_67292 [Cryphonectria parasitica EP155]